MLSHMPEANNSLEIYRSTEHLSCEYSVRMRCWPITNILLELLGSINKSTPGDQDRATVYNTSYCMVYNRMCTVDSNKGKG